MTRHTIRRYAHGAVPTPLYAGDESLTQFPADEAFRSHLARAVLDAIESGAEHG